MEVTDKKVFFFNMQKRDKGAVSHDLKNMHISSIDTPEKKCLDGSHRLFGAMLNSQSGYRKVYFLTYEDMVNGIDRLVKA